jgi:putative RNA 2'-phosphotransferase
MEEKLTQLSKLVSYALRHAPEEFELKLDQDGWVTVQELLCALQLKQDIWKNLSEVDLVEMIKQSAKQRHEIKNGKIRALYGHSVPDKILKESQSPPEFLYHATSPEAAEIISHEGLNAMERHYIHLAADKKSAREVGYRKSAKPVLLVIRAKEANLNGINFYLGNENIWLADHIPPVYIDIV